MLNSNHRRLIADKLGDIGTYTIGAVLIGQLIGNTFNITLTVFGLLAATICFISIYYLLRTLK